MTSKKIIILLSGEIASGKSKICDGLKKDYSFHHISTKEILKRIFIRENNGNEIDERKALQEFGRSMDSKTRGKWVLDEAQNEIAEYERVLIDSIRIPEQLVFFRESFGQAVVHIHLTASFNWREEHFIKREFAKGNCTTDELKIKFRDFLNDPTEKMVGGLKEFADLVINTDDSQGEKDQVIRAVGFLRLLPPVDRKNVDIVVGGQFGSEGKGQVVAHLSPEYDCLVRVGGPNAGHKVFNLPKPYVFHLIPSGSIKAPNAKIVIGPGAVINEDQILDEINKFGIDPTRVLIDENVTIIQQTDIELEEKLDKIGSTKRGVGAATAKNILNRLEGDTSHKAKNSIKLKNLIGNAHELFEKLNAGNKKILVEGTQGTLLSIHHGIYPHVTSRDTSVGGCLAECGFGPQKIRKIIMVTRRYPIRVMNPINGSSGDFVSNEIDLEEISIRSGYPIEKMREIEKTSTTEKPRRIAEFSWDLFRRACEYNTPTDIALTFADYITYENQKARRYDQLSKETTKFIDELERCSGVPVSLISTRFAHRAIIDRRNWI